MLKRSYKIYSELERLTILRDYYESGSSKSSIARKYGMCHGSLITDWLSKYDISEKELLLWSQNARDSYMATKNNKRPAPDSAAGVQAKLEERIAQLEKALAFSKHQVDALNLMIDIAEREEGISIRKKSGVKQ